MLQGRMSCVLSDHLLLTWQSYPIIFSFKATDEINFEVCWTIELTVSSFTHINMSPLTGFMLNHDDRMIRINRWWEIGHVPACTSSYLQCLIWLFILSNLQVSLESHDHPDIHFLGWISSGLGVWSLATHTLAHSLNFSLKYRQCRDPDNISKIMSGQCLSPGGVRWPPGCT